jgi:hypothetical protein
MAASRRAVNWGEAIVPGIALLFGAAFFVQTWSGPSKALYWPIIVAVVFGLFWLLAVIKFIFMAPQEAASPAEKKPGGIMARYGRSMLIGGGALVYVVLVPYLGFTVGSFLFMLAIFRGLGSRKWVTNILVSAGITAFLHVALIVLMKMSLPQLQLGPLAI